MNIYSLNNRDYLYEIVKNDNDTEKEQNLFFYFIQPWSQQNPFENSGMKEIFEHCDTVVFDYPFGKQTSDSEDSADQESGKIRSKYLFSMGLDSLAFHKTKKPKEFVRDKCQEVKKQIEYISEKARASLKEDELDFIVNRCLSNPGIKNELTCSEGTNWDKVTKILYRDHGNDIRIKKIELKMSQEQEFSKILTLAQKTHEYLSNNRKILIIVEEEEEDYPVKIFEFMKVIQQHDEELSSFSFYLDGPYPHSIENSIPDSWLETLSLNKIKYLCHQYHLRYEESPCMLRFLSLHMRLRKGSPSYRKVAEEIEARHGRPVAFMLKDQAVKGLQNIGNLKQAAIIKNFQFPACWCEPLNAVILFDTNFTGPNLGIVMAFELTNGYQQKRFEMIHQKALSGGFIDPASPVDESSRLNAAKRYAHAMEQIEFEGTSLTDQIIHEMTDSDVMFGDCEMDEECTAEEHYTSNERYAEKHFKYYMDAYLQDCASRNQIKTG